MFAHSRIRKFNVERGLRSRRIGETVINKITPDRAEIKVGGPPPLPQAKVEWDREKKERIARLHRRLNA